MKMRADSRLGQPSEVIPQFFKSVQHTVGKAYWRCDIPPLEKDISYIQVSAGEMYTVLLRSDSDVVASGWDRYGQCTIPELEEGVSYTLMGVPWLVEGT